MSLNDGQHGEFNSELEDEYIYDAHPVEGTEIGSAESAEEDAEADYQEPLDTEHDSGSGSYAEDGRLEVAEDKTMMNGEAQIGSAAMYGPTEIGEDDVGAADRGYGSEIGFDDELGAAAAADRPGSEIGFDDELGAAAAADRPGSEIFGESQVGHARNHGYVAKYGQSEIGRNGGYIAKFGPSEIGAHPARGMADHADHPYNRHGSGYTAVDGQSEIGAGHYPIDGGSEIGRSVMFDPMQGGGEGVQAPFEAFMLDEVNVGEYDFYGGKFSNEFGIDAVGSGHYPTEGASEIGAAAIAKVIEKARDNRQPAPPMKAASVDDPFPPEDDFGLTDVVIGAAVASGNPDPFPLTSQLLLRAGAATEPRFVRVDTEESYKAFLVEQSPELADLKARFEAHVSDPHAHGGPSSDIEERDDLSDDIEDLVHLGAAVEADQAQKRVELFMPKRFDGLVTAWREGDFVCASMTLPGKDGEVRICTSLEPISKCVAEMSRHAAEANVPAASVVGAIPAMGCVLGAGTALKEMAAAAPAILKRPEAKTKMPFMVRIEPKVNPALGALAMLVAACRQGNKQACAEWQKLGELSAGPVRQAMAEALQLAKAAGA